MVAKVNPLETVYLILKILGALVGIGLLAFLWSVIPVPSKPADRIQIETLMATLLSYVIILFVYFRVLNFLTVGHLRGNGVLVSAHQFPSVYATLEEIGRKLDLASLPDVFVIQNGGLLNAYAARFGGSNYVAIYADLFAVLERDQDLLRFVLAHELTHVKRRHVQWRFWTFLAFYIPFLNAAYSRACEHTCDSFAKAVAGEGALKGLVLFAAGKDLYAKLNFERYLRDAQESLSFGVRFAEKFFNHPYLPTRLRYLNRKR